MTKKSELLATIVSYDKDGNFHACILAEPNSHSVVDTMNNRAAERALSMNGTCKGEHRVGIGKCHHLSNQLGEVTIEILRFVKKMFNPKDFMNLGKVIKVHRMTVLP